MSLRERLNKTRPALPGQGASTPAPGPLISANSAGGGPAAPIGASEAGGAIDTRKTAKGEHFEQLKNKIHNKLVENLVVGDDQATDRQAIVMAAFQFLEQILQQERIPMSRPEREALVGELVEEIMGYGPIEPLLLDEIISEIMINGPNQVYVEKNGKLTLSAVQFRDDAHLMHVIERIVSTVGRRVDEKVPLVDARIKAPGKPYDGSRFNAVIPPLAIDGASVTIRKFKKDAGTLDKLLGWGSMTPSMAETLVAAMKSHMNIIISGGTGSGKTTMLNSLSALIAEDERIVTIEDAAELQLQQPHVVRLESRPANIEGEGAIPIRRLLINALRMRPDRIIVGECRGGETLDMLQAMNTGHDGSLTTLHANTPRDALSRIETMCLMNDNPLPEKAIRQQISSAVHLIVQVSRLSDGQRKTTSITEIVGMEGDTVTMQEIFKYEQIGLDERGRVIGAHIATGVRPRFADRAKAKGLHLANEIFVKQSVEDMLAIKPPPAPDAPVDKPILSADEIGLFQRLRKP
ncbi:MAG: CpaF family protein [Vampirovibrionales bacterium]|nr:CpaF family protein [Vampirovibrionales bacterium]